MSEFVLFGTITSIIATLVISIIMIQKKCYARVFTIFLFLYIIGQILGYVFNVEVLKAVVPSTAYPEDGAIYQIITSTAFPLFIAFMTDYVYKLLNKN